MKALYPVFLFAALIFSLRAAPFEKWQPSRNDLREKHPEILVREPSRMIVKGIPGDKWYLFHQERMKVPAERMLKLTLRAGGKGWADFGFSAHAKSGTVGRPMKKIVLEDAVKTSVFELAIPTGTRTIRLCAMIPPEADIRIESFTCEVTDKVADVLHVRTKLDRPEAIYQAGETAVITLTLLQGAAPLENAEIRVQTLFDGIVRNVAAYRSLKGEPITIKVRKETPGFVLLNGTVYDSRTGKALSRPIQLAGFGFSPEKIRKKGNAPEDLISYWKGEYAKLNAQVPPDFRLEPAGGNRNMLFYRLTCANFGGTRTYATVVRPRKEGKYPMIFTVPPAGNTVYQFSKTRDAIHVTISVFDREFPDGADYVKFNRPVWYFYQGASSRSSYYYYKSILGVMRVMDYAMTQIREWDGKHLAAVGRSQGGGFAMIMTALDPAVQAVAADVPALCDHNARPERRPGWPQLLDDRGAAAFWQDAPYFDAANFASFIKVPAVVSVGFIDTMCVPSSIYAAFNNLKGPKTIYPAPEYGHGWGDRSDEYDSAVKQLLKKTFSK